ncbi:MAG: serine/threonine-protein kinase [Cyanobacteria bacterium J06598_3]
MSYCINPWCTARENPHRDNLTPRDRCGACDTPLLIQGRYRLLRPLRALSDWEPSEIFEVDDRGQTKVLKLLRQDIFQPQFEREVETLQQLKHPGIPQVAEDGYFTVSLSNNRQIHCMVMEKIQGTNLDVWLQKQGSIDQATALNWIHQLVELLGHIHTKGLFHRDIKLSNIMLRPTGQLTLIDFGTVRPMTNTYLAKVGGSHQRDMTSVVSPGYTPLEQINGKAVPQSDFYALGRSMVYLLTGKHPIDLPEAETTGMLDWHSHTVQPVSDWFAQLLDDMMALSPAQRPLRADVLLARLAQKKLRAEKTTRDIKVLAIVNVGLLLLQLFIGWRWIQMQPQGLEGAMRGEKVQGEEQTQIL